MKKKPIVTAAQPTEVAEVLMAHSGGTPWAYRAQARPQLLSSGFKNRDLAVKAAIAAGFAAVLFEGKTIARPRP